MQGRPEQVEAALAAGADGVYLTLQDWGKPLGLEALAAHRAAGRRVYLTLPPMLAPSAFRLVRVRLAEGGFDGVLTGDLGAALALSQEGLAVCADSRINAANGRSVQTLLDYGVHTVALSNELTSSQAAQAAWGHEDHCEATIHGRLALMTLAHCPVRAASGTSAQDCHACQEASHALRDRKGYVFPLVPTRAGRCVQTLYNCVPLCMADAFTRLPRLGAYRIVCLEESAQEVATLIRAYRRLCDGKALSTQQLQAIRSDARTHGHWFRGVQ